MLPPEVMGAIVTFACLDAWHPASLEEFVCAPFSEELERLAMALMEAIFNDGASYDAVLLLVYNK
ncbi:Protein of unknown function [Cotesia congregata]|uniref:Uncharacterized protein n=1 Tax=Cotesia congregata TaxID=51543 RepID=A0A8J2MGC0_COTCN|nr:Protein of unknown function [Cotesia congregata]